MLTQANFTRIDPTGSMGYYFAAELPDCQICLERCFNGYCVALYLLPKDDDVFVAGDGHRLHGSKTCTQDFATSQDFADLSSGNPLAVNQPALDRAIEIANEKLAEWNEEKRAAGGT